MKKALVTLALLSGCASAPDPEPEYKIEWVEEECSIVAEFDFTEEEGTTIIEKVEFTQYKNERELDDYTVNMGFEIPDKEEYMEKLEDQFTYEDLEIFYFDKCD